MIDPAAVPPLVVGGLLLLFGWTLYRALLWIAGAFVGAAAGLGIGWLAAQGFDLEGTSAFAAQGIGALAGAAAGIAVFRIASAFAFFLFGAALGAWAFWAAYPLVVAHGNLAVDPDALLAIGLPASGLVAGALLAAMQKWAIALACALVGTLLVMAALDWPLGGWPAPFVFLAGLAVQARFARGPRDDDEEDDE